MKSVTMHHEVLDMVVRILTPVVLLFGAYLMLYGANSPGGGFQAGAILTALFIIRQLARPDSAMGYHFLKNLEKIIFLGFLLFASLCLFQEVLLLDGLLRAGFLRLMNVLIGMKVMCGLTIIFVRFVLMEGRESE